MGRDPSLGKYPFYQLVEREGARCWTLRSDWSTLQTRKAQRSYINAGRPDVGSICHDSQRDREESSLERHCRHHCCTCSSLFPHTSVLFSSAHAFGAISSLWSTHRAGGVSFHWVPSPSVLRGRCLWEADFSSWWCWTHLHMNWTRTSLMRPGEHASLPTALVSITLLSFAYYHRVKAQLGFFLFFFFLLYSINTSVCKICFLSVLFSLSFMNFWSQRSLFSLRECVDSGRRLQD